MRVRRRTGVRARGTRVRLCALLALAAGTCYVSSAGAAQWSIEPRLGWTLNYNSNLLLVPTGQLATGGTNLSLDSPFRRSTETTELDLIPHIDVQRFFRDSDLNAVNGSLQGSAAAHSERSSVKLTGGYERTSTLVTELKATGIVNANTRREASSAGLDIGHDATERQHLDLQTSFSDVIYPGGESSGLVGYRYLASTLTDTVKVSDRLALGPSAYVDHIHTPLTGYDARDVGGGITSTYQFSARTKLLATGSYSQTTTNGLVQHGYYWDLHSTRVSEVTQWDLEWTRALQPSGSGLLIRRDTVNLSALHSISERLDLTLSLQDVRNNNLEGGQFAGIAQYLWADCGVNRHLTPRWLLSGTAGYAQSRPIATNEKTARGWHAGLTFTWTPIPMSLSR